MDALHLHLALTHFPIIGTLIGIVVLAYGIIIKNDLVKKIALVMFVVMAVATIPVFLSGEEAEETVEHIAGIPEAVIEAHEELAETAIWFMGLLGVLSLVTFAGMIKNQSFANSLTLATLVLSLITAGIFLKLGNLGGQIRHAEIRADYTAGTPVENGEGSSYQGEYDDDDDDDDH